MKTTNQFDVAIIGSGIAGSSLAAILARHGLRTLVFEAKSHPRFAIGESMILETSETMRALAELYDVPELAYFSSENYASQIGTSHGVKRHFSFLYHRPEQPTEVSEALQAIIPKQPHGHELHLYRQDSDYFLLTTAVSYGAIVRQHTPVERVEFADEGATIVTQRGEQITADYVVDAGGFRSILAQQFGLRHHDLQTHSRAIFTHMVGVTPFHDVAPTQAEYDFPFDVSEGTIHHVFAGGWLWVIPFNNHAESTNPLCSVGLMLDPRVHPVRDDLTPEEEFYTFIAQFPDVAAHLAQGRAVRDWTRTGRIQYGSKQVVGDRFALLGHAAGFVDPLFSKGLYVSLMGVMTLAHLLLEARETADYSAAAFRPLEQQTQAYLTTNDRLIASAYKAFGNYRLWSAYTVVWLLGAYTELVKLSSMRAEATHGQGGRAGYVRAARQLRLAGGGFAPFAALTEEIDALIEQLDLGDETAVVDTIDQIHARLESIDWLPEPFRAVLHGKTSLPKKKLRLSLLRPKAGFMGQGAYRAHFFGNHSLLKLLAVFIQEKRRYSAVAIGRQRWGKRPPQPSHKRPSVLVSAARTAPKRA